MQPTHKKPACLPEQLLCSALSGVRLKASSRCATSCCGQCAPHSSAVSSRPALASTPAAVATWRASPLCDAHASASSSSVSLNASAAPLVSSGSACSTLTAERANTGRSVSPIAHTGLPCASTTTSAPRCADSTMPPRVASTSWGFITPL